MSQSNVPVEQSDVLGFWKPKKEDGTPLPDGVYYIRLTVYTTTETVFHTVKIVKGNTSYITNVSVVKPVFSPFKGETNTISYTLPQDGIVTLKIFTDKNKQYIRTLLNEVSQVAGNYSIVWDGKDGVGNLVSDGAYVFTIKVVVGNNIQIYQPADGGLLLTNDPNKSNDPNYYYDSNFKFTIDPQRFFPTVHQVLKITSNTSVLCRTTSACGTTECIKSYVAIGVPSSLFNPNQGAWENTFYWDGRRHYTSSELENHIVFEDDPNNKFKIKVSAELLPDKVMIAKDKSPIIENIKIDPVVFDPGTGQVVNISYTLLRDMNLTVEVRIEPVSSGSQYLLRTLVKNEFQSAGEHTITWDGTTDTGTLVSEGNLYAILIKGVDTYGMEASYWRVVQTRFHP